MADLPPGSGVGCGRCDMPLSDCRCPKDWLNNRALWIAAERRAVAAEAERDVVAAQVACVNGCGTDWSKACLKCCRVLLDNYTENHGTHCDAEQQRLRDEVDRLHADHAKLAALYTECELALHEALPPAATYAHFKDAIALVVDEVKRLRAGLPHPPDAGRTHWDGCWRQRGHHNCAVQRVEHTEVELAQVRAEAKDLSDDLDSLDHQVEVLNAGCVVYEKALNKIAEGAAHPWCWIASDALDAEPKPLDGDGLARATANLRHLYLQISGGRLADLQAAARGLLGPAIEALEAVYGCLQPTRATQAGMKRFVDRVRANWLRYWHGKDTRYGRDFYAFLGEALMTEFRLERAALAKPAGEDE